MLSLPICSSSTLECWLLLLQVNVIEIVYQLVRKGCWIDHILMQIATSSCSMPLPAFTWWHQTAKPHYFMFTWSMQIQPNQLLRLLATWVKNVIFLQYVRIQVTHQRWLLPRLRLSISLPHWLWLSVLCDLFLGSFGCIRSKSLCDSVMNDYLAFLVETFDHITFICTFMLFVYFRFYHKTEFCWINTLIIDLRDDLRYFRNLCSKHIFRVILEVSYNLHDFLFPS